MAGCLVTGPAVPRAPGGPESRKTPGVRPGADCPETKSITAPFVHEPSGARANGQLERARVGWHATGHPVPNQH